jgi:hypothetical protein
VVGATYISIQVPETPTDVILHALRSFNAEDKEGLSAWLAPPIGRWTAIYPQFSPEMERFAKRLSATTKGIVLALGAFDEDDLYCNICESGKDHGYFKVSVGRKRSGKQREPVIKKLNMLAAHADEAARTALLEKLCDLREATFIRDSLIAFCDTFKIANARCGYDHIRAGQYKDDLDQAVDLELVTPEA